MNYCHCSSHYRASLTEERKNKKEDEKLILARVRFTVITVHFRPPVVLSDAGMLASEGQLLMRAKHLMFEILAYNA